MSEKKNLMTGRKGSSGNTVGGPSPRKRNVGSAQGRLAEMYENREREGKMRVQAEDDRRNKQPKRK